MNLSDNINTAKISIIVTFYNIEDHVAKCLDSVLAQDMPDFEVIAVNDGSTDNTPYLLEEYAKKDARIQILTLGNGGPSWARNQGMLKTKGEYALFIDGDDFILPGCLSTLYSYATSKNADIVIFSFITLKDGHFGNPIKLLYPKDTLMDSPTAAKYMLLSGDYRVWNKFIKRSFYMGKNICFEEGVHIGEDVLVSYQMMCRAEQIFCIDEAFYVYAHRDTSVMNLPTTAQKTRHQIYCFDNIKKEMQKSVFESNLTEVFEYRYIHDLILLLKRCYSAPEQYKSSEDFKDAKTFLKDRFSDISIARIVSNSYLKFSYKVKAIKLKSGIYKLEKAITRFLKQKK